MSAYIGVICHMLIPYWTFLFAKSIMKANQWLLPWWNGKNNCFCPEVHTNVTRLLSMWLVKSFVAAPANKAAGKANVSMITNPAI